MEDLWKKFKQETQKHVQKINEFLNEKSQNEKSQIIEPEKPMINLENEKSQQLVWIEKSLNEIPNKMSEVNEQVQQIVLEKNETKKIERKKIYGKLKDLVKEIMEKENLSRAQAYRRAKKKLLENSNS